MERFFLFLMFLFVCSLLIYTAFFKTPGEEDLVTDPAKLGEIPVTLPENAWFREQVSGGDVPVLVDFQADWCGPCRLMHQVISEVEQKLEGKFRVVEVDIDEHQDLARYYNVTAIPMVLLFDQGAPVDAILGLVSTAQMEKFVARRIPSASAPEQAPATEESNPVETTSDEPLALPAT